MKIVLRLFWDSVFNLEKMEYVLKELNFWFLNIFVFNKKKLCSVFEKDIVVYFDVSNVVVGFYIIDVN